MKIILKIFLSTLFSLGAVSFATAQQMSSANFKMDVSATDTAGRDKASVNYQFLDAVGQSEATGESTSANFILGAGLMYHLNAAQQVDVAVPQIIDGITDLVNAGNLPPATANDVNKAIQDLEKALTEYAKYEGGNLKALANVFDDIRKAIDKLEKSGLADVIPYMEILAETAKLEVEVATNGVAATAGETDPNIVKARAEIASGSGAMLTPDYKEAIMFFEKAYKEVLKV